MSIDGLLSIDLSPVKTEVSTDNVDQPKSLTATQVQDAISKVVAKVLNTRDSEQILPASIKDLKVQIEQKLEILIAESPEGQVIELPSDISVLIANFNKLQDFYSNLKNTLVNLQTELDILHSNVIALLTKNAELKPFISRYSYASAQYVRNESEITLKQAKIAKKSSLHERLSTLLSNLSLETLPEIEKLLQESNLKFVLQAPKPRVSTLIVRVPKIPVIQPKASFSTLPELLVEETQTASTSTEVPKGFLSKTWTEFKRLPFAKQLLVSIAMGLPGAVSIFAISVDNYNDNTPAETSTTTESATDSNSESGAGYFSVTNFESTIMDNVQEMDLEDASPNFIKLVNYYNDQQDNGIMQLILLELAYDFVGRFPSLDSNQHELTLSITRPQDLDLNELAQLYNIDWSAFTYRITFNPSTHDFIFIIIDGDDMDSSFRIELEGRFEHDEAQ
jgi:ribosomal protein S8